MILTPLLLCAVLSPLSAPQAEDLFFAGNLAAARARAEQTGLMVMIELESPDQAETAAFDALVWTDAAAVRWVEVEVVAVRVSGAESDELAARWGIKQRPALLLQESDGLQLRVIRSSGGATGVVRSLRLTAKNRAEIRTAASAVRAAPESLEARMEYADVMARARLHREALEELEALWVSTRYVESARELRLGDIISRVTRMRGNYSKAGGTVNRWRKRAVGLLRQPPGEVEVAELVIAAEELGAINAKLYEADHSLEMYRKLKARSDLPPEVSQGLYNRHAGHVLFAEQAYEEFLEGSGGVLNNLEPALQTYGELFERGLAGDLGESGKIHLAMVGNLLRMRGSRYYEALLVTEDLAGAIALTDVLCARMPTAETYLNLMAVARRRRAPEELRRLGENGIALLPTAADVRKVSEVHTKKFKDG